MVFFSSCFVFIYCEILFSEVVLYVCLEDPIWLDLGSFSSFATARL